MVLLQLYDSPPGLSTESAREAGKGLPGVGRLTECAKGQQGFRVRPVGAAVPHWQMVPMRAPILEAVCLDLRNEIQACRESIVCFITSMRHTFFRHGTSVMDTTHDCSRGRRNNFVTIRNRVLRINHHALESSMLNYAFEWSC